MLHIRVSSTAVFVNVPIAEEAFIRVHISVKIQISLLSDTYPGETKHHLISGANA